MPRPALALALIRGVHTAIYVVMAGSVFAILYAGVTGAAGVWLWVALALGPWRSWCSQVTG